MVAEMVQYPLETELIAYQDLKEELERDHYGEWVVIKDSEIVGFAESYEDADKLTSSQGLNILDCLVQRVGVRGAIVLSYGV